MLNIRVLPPDVVNRIAAGEVVERPASVAKELIENALDANATEVAVHLEEGGKKRIQVRDNGCGIAPDDFELVFHSHATSKLKDEELASNSLGMSSLGFRGEAVASISAIAQVELVSQTSRAEHAFRYRPDLAAPEPCAGNPGTVIDVRNLFYNTPARRKFLRADSTELSHCVQQCSRIALSSPGVRFKVTHGQRTVLDLPSVDDFRDRLYQIVSRKISDELLEVREGDDPELPSLVGYVGSPRVHRRDTKEQHFFVNGRWVRDRTLSHALRSAYQGFHIPGYQSVAYLFLDFPGGEVDANVHPTKTEVRFRDSSSVYRLVFHAVRKKLESTQGEARGTDERGHSGSAEGACRSEYTMRDLFAEISGSEAADRVQLGRSGGDRRPTAVQGIEPRAVQPGRSELGQSIRAPKDAVFATEPAKDRVKADGGGSQADELSPRPAPADTAGGPTFASEQAARHGTEKRARFLQALETYLVVETTAGLVLIDQHALHEKILYEAIYQRLLDGVVESQRLLVPEVVEVGPESLPLVEQASESLKRCGFDLQPFGPDSVALHAIPAIFDREAGHSDLEGMVRAILDELQSGFIAGSASRSSDDREVPSGVDDLLRRIASTAACKRAVKAGKPLSVAEIESLLERGSVADDPRHCPHGRPTSVLFSKRDIEKLFDRK
ncbi:MAG: DNA mismatch repair endonuclease MutL [Planctomycetes bacterium]|nr:DNA mismatch repair endonuclease MutL [Planctomycetota bacterium]